MHKSILLGSLAVSGILIFNVDRLLAQITPDNTLGNESSIVNTRDDTSEKIDGGAIRGQNLFHSFEEFNVDAGRGVYFSNPEVITNIFSRVTGNNVSNILGTLGVDGAANLFLINPNGIIFGEGASLDVQGSFAATTADGIEFGEQGFFSATNPESPNLLTINPSAYLFNQIPPGAIANNSTAPDPTGSFAVGLSVPVGQNLSLIGGDITFNSGLITASGVRVEIGGLSAAGTIDINADGSLVFPANVARGNVVLSNSSAIQVIANGGGAIVVNSNNLELTEGSVFFAGIGTSLSSEDDLGGDIIINATDRVIFDGVGLNGLSSGISNFVLAQAVGNAGNIEIVSNELSLTNGGTISSSIAGQGNTGEISIDASQVSFDGILSGISRSILENGAGNTGNIVITTEDFSITNGGTISSLVSGRGNTGDLTIEASNNIVVDGGDIDPNSISASQISNFIFETGAGNIGKIDISGKNLVLTNGGSIQNSILGQGTSGTISIDTSDTISIDESKITSLVLGNGDSGDIILRSRDRISLAETSQITSNVLGVGNSGNIQIFTTNLQLSNSSIGNSNTGMGNAGNISIDVSELFSASNGSLINSNIGQPDGTPAEGKVGNIAINAKNITLTEGSQLQAGFFANSQGESGSISIVATDSISFDGNNSGIFTNVEPGAIADGSNIILQANSISFTNGSALTAGNAGMGNTGNILIQANDRFLAANDVLIQSNVGQSDNTSAVGNVGNINIEAKNVTLTGNAQLQAGFFSNSQGKSGSVVVKATDSIAFEDRSGIFTDVAVNAIADGGDIRLEADSISLTDTSGLTTSIAGIGNAGDIIIKANSFTLDRQSALLAANTPSASNSNILSGGNIDLEISNNLILNDSNISTQASTNANGGNINIAADAVIAFDDSDIFAFAAEGQGGNINLNTPAYFGENFTLNSLTSNPDSLRNNSQADINATGAVSGAVNIPDVSFIQNSLTELPDNSIDTDRLVADSCVAPAGNRQEGKFIITGKGGLPVSPGNSSLSEFSTGEVRSLPQNNTWKKGDPIVEPQGVYRLTNGKLVLSRECN
jgi:filamentous hemagglutinin family protein